MLETGRQLQQYLTRRRQSFSLPLRATGTPFQQQVWQVLSDIPYGSTISYAEVARRIGRPQASRAVAQACAANPLPLLIPCHRIVRGDGTAGGYSLPGGTELKQALLALETEGQY